MKLKAPFPWFGGKSTVARSVWLRLGDVSNYCEPFAGSAAMLLARPHPPRIETLNDFDCYVANFWRATQQDPEAVVEYADGPVNEADLHARHRWLVYSEHAAEWRLQMRRDPEHFDPKIAGWWCWGLCQWIGSGWCDAGAEWNQVPAMSVQMGINSQPDESGKRVKLTGGSTSDNRTHNGAGVYGQVHEKRPRSHREATSGEGGTMPGVHAQPNKMPRMTGARRGDEYYGGLGVHMEQIPDGRPQLADAYDIGRGVHASPKMHEKIPLPHRPTGHDEGGNHKGVHADKPSTAFEGGTCQQRRLWLLDWFGRLRDRLRNVRVCCGDWERVCGSPSVTTRLGVTGVFFDPPYAKDCGRMLKWARFLRDDGPEPTDKVRDLETGVIVELPHSKCTELVSDGKAEWISRKSTNRAGDLYSTDDHDVDHLVARVHNYCRERGADPQIRIALAGYDGEHNELEELGWQPLAWKANGGYGNRNAGANENAVRERIWFSPHCLPEIPEDSDVRQVSLFT